jgi:hypothetical protein
MWLSLIDTKALNFSIANKREEDGYQLGCVCSKRNEHRFYEAR